MRVRDLLASSVLSMSISTLAACAEEPSSFTGSSTSTAAGPGATTGPTSGAGGESGDGGASHTTGGSTTGSSNPTTSGDGGAGPSTSGTGGAGPQEVAFEIALDDAVPELDLRSNVDLTVTITENGYVGPVLLHVDGLPGDVDALLDAESVTLDGTGTTQVGLTLQTRAGTVSGDFDFTVTGTVEAGDASAFGSLVVHPTITIVIPENLASFDGQDNAFGPYPTTLALPPGGISSDTPVTVLFFNADTVDHEIHADNPDQGFGHGQGPIGAGELDPVVREINAAGTYNYYPHDIGTGIPGRIVIE